MLYWAFKTCSTYRFYDKHKVLSKSFCIFKGRKENGRRDRIKIQKNANKNTIL